MAPPPRFHVRSISNEQELYQLRTVCYYIYITYYTSTARASILYAVQVFHEYQGHNMPTDENGNLPVRWDKPLQYLCTPTYKYLLGVIKPIANSSSVPIQCSSSLVYVSSVSIMRFRSVQ